MYKVLIADDEKIIRMGLRTIIDWEAMGFEIIKEAATGKAALEIIAQDNPDLVMFDIRMPGMLGLEALEKAREAGFSGKVIVLSGYSDFEYAQTAIKHGIVAYLTKPVDVDELTKALSKAKEELDARISSEVYLSKAKDNVLKDILKGEVDPSTIQLKDIGLEGGPYQLLFYEKYSLDSDSPEYSFAELLRVTDQSGNVYDELEIDGTQAILLKGSHIIEKLRSITDRFHMELPPEKNSPLDSVFIAVGNIAETENELNASYSSALYFFRHRFFCDKGQHIISGDNPPVGGMKLKEDHIPGDQIAVKAQQEKYADTLVEAVQTFNRNRIAMLLRELQTELYTANLTVEEEKNLLVDLYLNIKEKLMILYSTAGIPFLENSEAVRRIIGSFYLYEIITFISEQLDMIMTSIGYSSRDSIIDDVIFYIKHNFQSNITLENIAPLFGYNSSYLGKIFSKKMGVNFNTYLDSIRIESSKELLLSSKSQVYRVAEKVGYRNVDYFHIKFKKYTGMSPAEFRKKYAENAE